MFIIGVLVVVAIVMEVFDRLNPFKKPEPSYQELVDRIKAAAWYQELYQEERYRRVLEEDPHVVAFYSGPYEAKRLLENEGYQLGLIDYVKEQAGRG
ncbi:hypothetical protein [Brevibacillus dissolubilis]|uniref:hypothetical protein n=1 Tax=Brevibacillus dissolubilis TaxID=1844116 RepID=UPI00111652B6|nr:hypothetical protein [Brevibacillus dissolubilis]